MKKWSLLILICFFGGNAIAQKSNDKGYGDNLIALHPYFGYATPELSDLGVGISYERFLNEYMSAKLPLNFGLAAKMFQTGIGLKFYPTGHDRTIKYAVGPSLLFTRSTDGFEVSRFDSTGMFFYTEEVDNPLTQLGFALTNSLNMTIKKNIYIGAEMGIGINYINNYKEDLDSGFGGRSTGGPNVLFMFNLSMGYRF